MVPNMVMKYNKDLRILINLSVALTSFLLNDNLLGN